MALENSDSRVAHCLTALAHRVLLFGVVGVGLATAGCGGSSETAPAASESASGSDSAMSDQSLMTDESMMRSEEMNDPSMDSSMEQSMADQAMTEGTDPAFGDTSLGHGEGEPGSEAEMLLASNSASDPNVDEAAMTAQMEADEAAANTTSDPSGNEAAMAAQMAADETAANGQPGSESGEFGPEAGGTGPSGEGGGGAQEPPADSPDYPAFKIVMGLMQGKHEGLKEFVSTTGRGLIEKIRSGSLTTEEKDDLKKTFAQPQLVGTPRTIRGSRTVTLNSDGQVITLVSKKQGSDWKVSSISIKAASKR